MNPSNPFWLRSVVTVGAAFALVAQGCAAPTDDAGSDEQVENAAEITEAVGVGCPKKATAGDYTLCVWQSLHGVERMTIVDRAGRVVQSGEVTTSNFILASEGPGVKTCPGTFRLAGYQAETSPPESLKNFFSIVGCGNGGVGVHYYPEVGAQFDSHGCVRVKWALSEWMRQHLAAIVDHQDIYIHIIPPK